jgi:hypothetical protein
MRPSFSIVDLSVTHKVRCLKIRGLEHLARPHHMPAQFTTTTALIATVS